MSNEASQAVASGDSAGAQHPEVEAQSDATRLLAALSSSSNLDAENASTVQSTSSDSALPKDSSPLGEFPKSGFVGSTPPSVASSAADSEISLAPKSFHQFEAIEFHNHIVTKLPALKSDIDIQTFISFDLSVKTFLSTIDSSNFASTLSEFGIDPVSKAFKFRILENFLLNEINSDSSIPVEIRNYWASFKSSKVPAVPISPSFQSPQVTPASRRGSDNLHDQPNKQLKFDSPQMLLPGCANLMNTPSFYSQLGNTTGSLFHMLDQTPASLAPSIVHNVIW